MRSSFFELVASVGLVCAIGCGGSKPAVHDMAVKNESDLGISEKCLQLADFPSTNASLGGPVVSAYYLTDPSDIPPGADYEDDLYGLRPNDLDDTAYDIMFVYLIHAKGAAPFTVPVTTTFTSTSTPLDFVGINYDQDCTQGPQGISCEGGTLYAPASGSMTATQLGTAGGTMAVSGTNLHLVEWPMATDQNTPTMPVPNGKCIDLASFNWSATLGSDATDGGT